jgi:hypothetical protein
MEQNRELRNKPMHLPSLDSQQRCQQHTMGSGILSINGVKNEYPHAEE